MVTTEVRKPSLASRPLLPSLSSPGSSRGPVAARRIPSWRRACLSVNAVPLPVPGTSPGMTGGRRPGMTGEGRPYTPRHLPAVGGHQ